MHVWIERQNWGFSLQIIPISSLAQWVSFLQSSRYGKCVYRAACELRQRRCRDHVIQEDLRWFLPKKKIRPAFEMLDTNHDGKVTLRDCRTAVTEVAQVQIFVAVEQLWILAVGHMLRARSMLLASAISQSVCLQIKHIHTKELAHLGR